MMIQRPFSSGSRQAPDPHDNFLEQAGFYRKHTARDSSCLFRAISEQMYDTQNHHMTIRETCVSFMRNNKFYFQKSLKQYIFDADIDEYLDELSKSKTFGSLLELEAMAHMFERNVILFRPLEVGRWFFYTSNFNKNFQVFVSHDRHFDTVYTNNFIEDAAFCQSIVYELLYKHVFKLPDITYAVERMLHATSFEEIDSTNEGMYCRKIYLKDGRTFELDIPENTDCILNDYELCHFHNPNFPELAEMLQNEVNKFQPSYLGDSKITSSEYWPSYGTHSSYIYTNKSENTINDNDFYDCNSRLKQLDSVLPEKYISCVRQLLYEGITPFPYKVAKALDPDMYRNIEFDSWSEMRKEQRWKNWYTGGTNLQVGVKCQVYLRKQDEFYTGYIQEMPETQNGPCIVFIEDLGEKRTVPYDCLKPLPPDQVKPWPLPYRWQKQFEKYQQQQTQMYSPAKFFKRFSNHSVKCKMLDFDSYDIMQSYPLDQDLNEKDDINLKLKQYCNLDNFTPSTIGKPIELITLPFTVENDRTPLTRNTQMNQNKITDQPLLDSSNKIGETSSRPPSVQESQQQTSHQHMLNCEQEQEQMSGSTYIEENNRIIESNSTIAVSNMNDVPCPYAVYNYYSEPYYAYPFDNSIIHATSSAPSYYCYLPNPAANLIQHNGQTGSVFMPSGHPLSPTTACGSAGTFNNHIQALNYYPTSATQPLFSTSASVPQPIINQPISNGRQLIANNNPNTNVNFAVQKSIMESGIDLPNDIPTLRFFFNLGWDYYNEVNDARSKDEDNVSTKLAIDFQKIKIENENSNQEVADSNNNIITNNSTVNETSNSDQCSLSQNLSQSNNVKGNHPKNNNANNNRDNKHFTSRYFNNRKSGNYNSRGNGVNHNNRYAPACQTSRSHNGTHIHNSRNDRNLNINPAIKGGTGSRKNDLYQKINNCNNNNGNESDNLDVTNIQSNNKNKEIEIGSHISPNSTSEHGDSNQPLFPQQRNVQPVTSASVTPYTVPYYSDHPTSYGSEQYATVAVNGAATNSSILVPQVITPVPIGMCQTVPPPNAGTPSYSSIQPGNVSHNTNYFVNPGRNGPINTSYPPPPLPTTGPPHQPQPGAITLIQPAPYPMQTQHLQQQGYYYPYNTQATIPATTANMNAAASEASTTSSLGGGGGDGNIINFTPEPTGPYPFMNFNVYYPPTNNGGLTPTGNNSNNNIQSGGSVNGNPYQGYWLTPAPVASQIAITTPTSNNKINYSGNANMSH